MRSPDFPAGQRRIHGEVPYGVVIERNVLGGEVVTTGGVPTKTLREAVIQLTQRSGKHHVRIQDLFARIYADDNVYTHRWQTNDVILWDNLALQHSRPAEMGLPVRRLRRQSIHRRAAVAARQRRRGNVDHRAATAAWRGA